MRDLQNPGWMYAKAILFLVVGVTSMALVVAGNPRLKTCLLVSLGIWAFCRAYYFAFYVIEKYVDPTFKFSGLFSFAAFVLRRRRLRKGVTAAQMGR